MHLIYSINNAVTAQSTKILALARIVVQNFSKQVSLITFL